MTRREFLLLSAGFAVVSSCRRQHKYPIFIHNIASKAHLLREAINWSVERRERVDVAVVGAGIAGMAAAAHLSKYKTAIIDPENTTGGTALARQSTQGHWLPQGAHYDLEYPQWFGQETLHFLEKAQIISFDNYSQKWKFKDSQYLIDHERETLCLEDGEYRTGVLPDISATGAFHDFTKGFVGKVGLPSSKFEIKKQLSQGTFYEYLRENNLSLPSQLLQAIDYQMRDDYGGGSDKVTAWAGLVYYAARRPDCSLFAPPQGNCYFIQKIEQFIDKQSFRLNSLVLKIHRQDKDYLITCADFKNQTLFEINCKAVVYAAPKFTLRYVMPELSGNFQSIEYSPWLCINLVVKDLDIKEFYWQNEMLGFAPHLIGFVDSGSQKDVRVLTAYYCFPPGLRPLLLEEERLKTEFLDRTVQAIEFFWDCEIRHLIQEVHIRPIGHGIAIPSPKMANLNFVSRMPNFVFAGADTGRLPLMLDALDSGLQAAKQII